MHNIKYPRSCTGTSLPDMLFEIKQLNTWNPQELGDSPSKKQSQRSSFERFARSLAARTSSGSHRVFPHGDRTVKGSAESRAAVVQRAKMHETTGEMTQNYAVGDTISCGKLLVFANLCLSGYDVTVLNGRQGSKGSG